MELPYGIPLPAGYRWQEGKERDRVRVQEWLQATLQESFPDQQDWRHLEATVARLYDPLSTPCWWIMLGQLNRIGCLWIGTSLDQITGKSVGYMFMLRVDPDHRRRGLGRTLLLAGETWARQKGLSGLCLQVFASNQTAIGLYTQTGFVTQGFWLGKSFAEN
ncbi:MAG: GNAT family N-acetyltransferase [Cyanobacteriota bacterium]|nr:GNAT family N-acetyltransferase [Cyanobacteriota bacterium]